MPRPAALLSAITVAVADAALGGGVANVSVVGSPTARRCVFVHGIGVGVTKPTSNTDDQEYWGGTANIAQYTPYCKERFFLQQDTLSRGWDDPSLVEAFCAAAISSKDNDNVIRDTVVISHSMGNLMVAEAIRGRTCVLDRKSSSWVSLSAPWKGSQVVPWLFQVCSHDPPSAILRWLAEKLGYCDPEHPGDPHVGYDSLRPDYPGIESGKLTKVARTHVTHAVCGNSAYGLTSYLSAALEALAAAVGFTDPNDGMVGVSSCQLPGLDYSKSFQETTHYLASINHADSTCRNGNGAFGKASRQPCLWLRNIFDDRRGTELGEAWDNGEDSAEDAVLHEIPDMDALENAFWVRSGVDVVPNTAEIVV